MLFSHQLCPALCNTMNCSMPSPSKITALLWRRGLHNSMKLWAMPCRATQDGWVIPESSDKTWSTGGENANHPSILAVRNSWTAVKRASGWDGISVELFKTKKDDAIKVLHSICQQIWKTQQWPQDWKRSILIPIPKKGSTKECANHQTIALISHASKVMLKILHARLQHYVNQELPDVQADFRKGIGTRNQIANNCWIIEKARKFQKKHLLLFHWLH